MRSELLALALLMMLAASAAGEDGPIAYWPMEQAEGGVVADATGNGHDATYGSVDGSQPEFVDGIAGNAVRFAEANEGFFTVAGSEDFNFDGPFTVMAWVKPSRRNAAFAIACMKGDKSGDPPWPGWRLRFFWARAMLQVGTPGGEEPSVSTAEWSVPAGFWSHVAGSWDGEQLRIFVNGVEKAGTEFRGQIAPQVRWRPLILGNYMGRKNAYAFDGLLDEVRIFDRALTEDEVFVEAAQVGKMGVTEESER